MIILLLSFNFLWKIEINGNDRISTVILEDFLKEKNITYGMPLNKIPLEKLEKEIRKKFLEITWVSVSIDGTTLEIWLKENDTAIINDNSISTDIICNKKGKIDSILVRQGTGCVKVGDEVEKNTVLIKGSMEIKNEDGTISIDETMCNGCGLCMGLCKFDAIELVEV